MKKFTILGLAAFSLGTLHATDPMADNSKPQPPVPATSPEAATKPLPPLESLGRGPRDKKFQWQPDRKKMEPARDRRFFRGPKQGEGSPKFGEGEMLARTLHLNDDQKAKAKSLMEAAKPKIEAIREEERARVKAVIMDSLKELRPLLSPEQQAVLDDLQKLHADQAALPPKPKSEKPIKTKESKNNKLP